MCDDERGGRWDHGDGWWHRSPGSRVTNGANALQTGLQADGARSRVSLVVADRHGRPVPRRVHRVGFQAEMVTEEN